MQGISGPSGKEKVHYEAPIAGRLDAEMKSFWFVTIHPFDDGNGHIARAIADMALARSEDSPQRFYIISAQIGMELATTSWTRPKRATST